MSRFEVVAGLPATGPLPEQFSATGLGKHSEGLVVRFLPLDVPAWIGNFQPGLTARNVVLNHPDAVHVIVIAGGQGYVVHPSTRHLLGCFGGQLEYVRELSQQGMLVLGNGLWFEGVGPSAHWRTRRLSWDGMRNIEISGTELVGEAWGLSDIWVQFRVNLMDGSASGGSYEEVPET